MRQVNYDAECGMGIEMRICGLNKTTLLDYPEHVAATVFLGGCNFRCPFCQNGELVLHPFSQPEIARQEVMSFLQKRKGILTGVCITGGEPTMEGGLKDFIREIKQLDYLVKLDTNGYHPEVIEELLKENLLDYIAMDIKNCIARYPQTIGRETLETERILASVALIMDSGIDYEFRTTVVKELHGEKEMTAIGKEIAGAEAYFLQSYQESEGVIAPGFHACGRTELEALAECVRPYVGRVELRGIDGM